MSADEDDLKAEAEEILEDLGESPPEADGGLRAPDVAGENTSWTAQGTAVIAGATAVAVAAWVWRRRRHSRPTQRELAAQPAVQVRGRAAELGVAAANSAVVTAAAGRAREIATTPENTRRAQGAAAATALLVLFKLMRRRRARS
ncbi:MAG: hypothetical protein ABIS86_08975 [Streptosporangiaceae bacterium]